jgi:putative transposase
MSVAERREAVGLLQTKGISVRRACVLVQLQRATFVYRARPQQQQDELVAEIASVAHEQPRYGYRRVWAVLKRSRKLNRKRVHRLWKRAGLQVKRVPRGVRRERPKPLAAAYPNHVWAYDFVEDHDALGGVLRILTVMDEFTREALAVDVDTTSSAERVIRVLSQLVASHGAPDYLRSDNGAEFTALAVQTWLAKQQIQTLYIDPGCPWQNGKHERFNGTLRDECLNREVFVSLREARVHLESFRRHYNEQRPHSRLAYQTPIEFKQAWIQDQAANGDPNIAT